MTLQEALSEARFKHNPTVENWWEYADAMEEQGVSDFKRIYCQICGYSTLDYGTSPPCLLCKRFNGRVSEYDTCKYATIDQKVIQIMNNVISNSSSNDGRSNSRTSSSGNSGGCYVATAVYGSYDCPPVWTLRRFRDNVLKNYVFGRIFIRFYYAVSPCAVKKFGKNKYFYAFCRRNLDPLVTRLNERGFSSDPYKDN